MPFYGRTLTYNIYITAHCDFDADIMLDSFVAPAVATIRDDGKIWDIVQHANWDTIRVDYEKRIRYMKIILFGKNLY